MKNRPNIVLITIDSLRADFVGYLNPKENNTPFLDSFAKRSCSFTNGISPASPTFFVFSTIMTGIFPFTLGKYLGIPQNDKIKTLAEVLKDHGYATLAFLADSPALYSVFGYDRGFEFYDDGYEHAHKFYLSLQEILWNLRQRIPEYILNTIEIIHTFLKALIFTPSHSVPGKNLNEKVTKYFLATNKEPFFLWLHYMDVHLPFFSGLHTHFSSNNNFFDRTIKKIIFYKELMTSIRKMKLRNENIEIFKEAYRSCVKYVDQYIGEIVHFLKTKYPNTVFVIVSDHGEAFMEHDMFGHEAYSLYNELIRIPIIIHASSQKANRVSKTVSLVSLAKTIAAIAGVKEEQFQGNNIVDDHSYSSINNVSRILYKCRSPHVRLGILDNKTEIKGYTELWSFTTPTEKYIRGEDGRTEEYYNLSKDPFEKKNEIRNENSRAKKLNKLLQSVLRRSGYTTNCI